ncbi:Beta-galactosidase 9 [Turnera subulata]|uniref:Beta-galactosidase 9 n=1 Tax=Turnera subulata TaxID=218843 RepID=A0A9Q0GGI7_9ROSI|nr:Beta-galactosidase 9 [Turnera subulata]
MLSVPFGSQGSAIGTWTWVKVVQPIQLQKGYNDLVLVSQTVGLQNYGAHLERDGAGFRGEMKLTGFKNGDLNLLDILWTYQVGLKGECLKIYAPGDTGKAEWVDLSLDAIPSTFTWYKTYFDVPAGDDPVALDLGSMGKGQAWVNGHHHIGRYWTIAAAKEGCKSSCDCGGAYHSDKCTTNCGNPCQIWYHVPIRSWLQVSNDLLVVFEETGGNPFEISVKLRATRVICAQVSESHYPPPHKWLRQELYGNVSSDNVTPEMNLRCEGEHIITSTEFSSYGTPQGSCQNFSQDSCHAPNSLSVVSKACQGRKECNIKVSNAVFGDPWRGIIKTLAVEAKCTRSSNNGSFQY